MSAECWQPPLHKDDPVVWGHSGLFLSFHLSKSWAQSIKTLKLKVYKATVHCRTLKSLDMIFECCLKYCAWTTGFRIRHSLKMEIPSPTPPYSLYWGQVVNVFPGHFLLGAHHQTVRPHYLPSIPRSQGPRRCRINFTAHSTKVLRRATERKFTPTQRLWRVSNLALVTRKINRICFHFKKKYQNASYVPHVVLFPFCLGRSSGEMNKVNLTHSFLIRSSQVQIIFSRTCVGVSVS